jgi:SAM-dependent methyltransferase
MIRGALRRTLTAAVRGALREPHVRRIAERELALSRPRGKSSPDGERVAVAPRPPFVDRHGVAHELDPALRDRLKPSWRVMTDPDKVGVPLSDDDLRARAQKAETNVREAVSLVSAAAGVELGGRILEIGCYDGATAFQLALRLGADVVGSDLARYYVVQRPGQPSDEAVEHQQVALVELRERARVVAGAAPGKVTFVEDDITATGLEPNSFDAIVSFEVLEHVQDPRTAFIAMARLLRPGGIVYHDYNPFFAANGGHSLCTLDFPWGHARLDAADFERYVADLRPYELAQALRFYSESLNRMTQADLRDAIDTAGLDLCALIPWNDRTLVASVTDDLVAAVQRVHPGAVVEDLLGTFVAVVARRPEFDTP